MSDRDYIDQHEKDHRAILSKLDENRSIWNKINEMASLERDVILLNERIMEMKDEKEKASSQFRWIMGMAFAVIMSVAAAAIDQNATVQVLEEKVSELKTDLEAAKKYANQLEDWVDFNFVRKDN